jgi:hypothetical protein
MFLCKLPKVGHEGINRVFHVKMPDGDPYGIGLCQQRYFLLLSPKRVFICISVTLANQCLERDENVLVPYTIFHR